MKKIILKCILIAGISPCDVFCSSIPLNLNDLDGDFLFHNEDVNPFNIPSECFFQSEQSKSCNAEGDNIQDEIDKEQNNKIQNTSFKLCDDTKNVNDSINLMDNDNLSSNDTKVENLLKLIGDCNPKLINQNSINTINSHERFNNQNTINTINHSIERTTGNFDNTLLDRWLSSLSKYASFQELNLSLLDVKEKFDKSREEHFTLSNTQIDESINFYSKLLNEMKEWLIKQDSKKAITWWEAFDTSYCELISEDDFLSKKVASIFKIKTWSNFWDIITTKCFNIDEFISEISQDYFIYRNSGKCTDEYMSINLNADSTKNSRYKFLSYCLTWGNEEKTWLNLSSIFHFDKNMERKKWINSVYDRFYDVLDNAKKIFDIKNIELDFDISSFEFLRKFEKACCQKSPLSDRIAEIIKLANLTIKVKIPSAITKSQDEIQLEEKPTKISVEEDFIKNPYGSIKTLDTQQIPKLFLEIHKKFNSTRNNLIAVDYLKLPLLNESVAFYQSVLDNTIGWILNTKNGSERSIWYDFTTKYFKKISKDNFLSKMVVDSLIKQAKNKSYNTVEFKNFDINKVFCAIKEKCSLFLKKHNGYEYMPIRIQKTDTNNEWYNLLTYCLQQDLPNAIVTGLGYIFQFDERVSKNKYIDNMYSRIKNVLNRAQSLLQKNGLDFHYKINYNDFVKVI